MSLKKNIVSELTTSVAGIEISNKVLADWILLGVKHLSSEKKEFQSRIEILDNNMKEMLTVHYCLLGAERKISSALC